MADQAERLQSPEHLQSHSHPRGFHFVRFPLRSLHRFQLGTISNSTSTVKQEYYFSRKICNWDGQKRKRVTPTSSRSAITRALLVTVCFAQVKELIFTPNGINWISIPFYRWNIEQKYIADISLQSTCYFYPFIWPQLQLWLEPSCLKRSHQIIISLKSGI